MQWKFRDDRKTAVLIATGPSAGVAPLDLARGWPTIVVNDAFRLAPWADALYAADRAWWQVHHAEVAKVFHGERWTPSAEAAEEYSLRRVHGRHASGLCEDPAIIHYNLNGGAQALNLAYHWGARRFVLVGYDMGPVAGRGHFFGDHPAPLRNASPWEQMVRTFGVIAEDCRRLGLEVVNTSSTSRLRCFPRATLNDALGGDYRGQP